MASRDVTIAPTTDFRLPDTADRVIAEHKSGYLKEDIPPASGEARAVLPPAPTRDAPRESIASRIQAKLEQRSK
jgi:hypothetical protein